MWHYHRKLSSLITYFPRLLTAELQGYGAVLNTAKVERGSTVAVFGLGGVGLGVSTNQTTSRNYKTEKVFFLRLFKALSKQVLLASSVSTWTQANSNWPRNSESPTLSTQPTTKSLFKRFSSKWPTEVLTTLSNASAMSTWWYEPSSVLVTFV